MEPHQIGEELGYYLHMIYNEHCLDEEKKLFEKFNLQQYFK